MKFTIPVTRIGYSCKDIEVDAPTLQDAERIALEQASSEEFSEHESEYKIS